MDWPPGSFTDGGQGERDNHEMLPVNTVVNAFHCHALRLMSRISQALGNTDNQNRFSNQANRVHNSINHLLFDHTQGIYVDGESSEHSSLHSNMFMLAFDLVPDDRKASVISFVKSRGMACSVYGAQYLLEALYQNGEDQYALEMMTAQHDRSWWNMIQCGSTITMEAWDLKYKNNLDWNHAWGAAPANIIPRFVLGVRPLEPGFSKVLIQPQPGSLKHLSGTVPTIHGPVSVFLESIQAGSIQKLSVTIPAGTKAKIGLKLNNKNKANLLIDGKEADSHAENKYLYVNDINPGTHVLVYE